MKPESCLASYEQNIKNSFDILAMFLLTECLFASIYGFKGSFLMIFVFSLMGLVVSLNLMKKKNAEEEKLDSKK